MRIPIKLRTMLRELPDESISKIIRECESELGHRGEKFR